MPLTTMSPSRPTEAHAQRHARRPRPTPLLGATVLGLAPLLAGCSSQVIVAGNVVSMLLTFALFYTTINLRPGR